MAGCNYFMGVPCADDVMLNYQSTSYHDAAGVRQILGLRPAPEFSSWLEERGIFRAGRLAHGDRKEREQLLNGVERLLTHQFRDE
jgi:ethanolamine ammonia-lyase large subunit